VVAVRFNSEKDRKAKMRELLVLRSIQHPNIVTFLGFQHYRDAESLTQQMYIFSEVRILVWMPRLRHK
jgi:serine/threonine protein kinase